MKTSIVWLIALCALVSCTEKIDTSARYVYNEQTAMGYLRNHPDTYSEYTALLQCTPVSSLSSTTVGQLLDARGHYTIFAPTNEAIEKYLADLVDEGLIDEPSWEAFTDSAQRDSIHRIIVQNSIIDSGDNEDAIRTTDFPVNSGEELSLPNMNDRKLSVYYQGGKGRTEQDIYGNTIDCSDSIYINGTCPINQNNRDIPVLNGYIHQTEKVIDPKCITAADYLESVIHSHKDGYLTMARAIQACGLFDTLRAVRDEVYENLYKRGYIHNLEGMTYHGFAEGSTAYAPEHRKYGFTLFLETDDFWRQQGIDPSSPNLLGELQEWVEHTHQYSDDDKFTADNNYRSEHNLLYQWVTYHMLPHKTPPDKLVIHENEQGYSQDNPSALGCAVYDLYTTFGKRRLLKTFESKESGGVYLNRFPVLDNGRKGNYHELYCDADKEGVRIGKDNPMAVLSDIVNAYIYPIDKPLAYTDAVRDNLHKQRLRIDAMSMLPEAISNDIRKAHHKDEKYQHVYIPNSPIYPYFDNLWIADGSHFVYYNAYTIFYPNLNSDEIKAVGYYDLTFKLPPVPSRGTYELRWGYDSNVRRGMAQIFFGNHPDRLYACDIPLDIRVTVWEGDTGFEPDTGDEDYDAEVDKRMRNKGYMKGGHAWTEYGHPPYTGRQCSSWQSPMRRIIHTGVLDPDETYYLRIKSVLDNDRTEFMMDMIEFCPKEIYDNPNEPEDIW